MRLPKSRLTASLLGLWLVCVTSPAWPYAVGLTDGDTGQVVRWMTNSVGYYLHPSCSADLNTNTCLNALRDSFDEWEGHACGALTFTELGSSSNLQLTAVGWDSNGKNELAFIEGSAWQYGTYTLGITAPWFYDSGQITEADIAFNGYQQTWSTSGADWSTDVKNVAVHEIGHMVGMQHMLGGYDSDNPPTMAPTADPYMKSRTPEPDDIDGLCFLYPKGAWSCASNDDCPLINADGPSGEYYAGQLACTGGSCGGFSNEIPEGNAQMGDPCAATYDCAEPFFCQPVSGSGGVCTEKCNPNASGCPSGYDCVPLVGSSTEGVCLEAQGNNGTKSLGESCSSSGDCISQLCVQTGNESVCMQMCTDDSGCGANETCALFPGAGYGACVDGGGGTSPPGTKQLGEECSSPTECISELCAGDGLAYICVEPCSGPGSCPSGYVCYALQGGNGGGCFEVDGGEKGLGEDCLSIDECESGMCVSFDGGANYFCTDNCVSQESCPCGMACVETLDGDQFCNLSAKIACVPDGQACAASTECISGACVAGICENICNIYQGGSSCPAGMGCQRLGSTGVEGSCQPVGSLPHDSSCGSDGQCQSLFCLNGYCQEPCNEFAPNTCPSGQTCRPAGEYGVCSPYVPPPEPEPEPDPPSGSDAGTSVSTDTTSGADAGPIPPTPDATTTVPPPLVPQDVTEEEEEGGFLGCASGGGADGPLSWLMTLAFLMLVRRREAAVGQKRSA